MNSPQPKKGAFAIYLPAAGPNSPAPIQGLRAMLDAAPVFNFPRAQCRIDSHGEDGAGDSSSTRPKGSVPAKYWAAESLNPLRPNHGPLAIVSAAAALNLPAPKVVAQAIHVSARGSTLGGHYA